jgi:hypothetical protein
MLNHLEEGAMFKTRERQIENAMRSIQAIRECLVQMRSLNTFSSVERQEIDEVAGCLNKLISHWEARDISCRKANRYRPLWHFLGLSSQ